MVLPVVAIVGVAPPARSFELSGGVSLGGVLAGTVPRLAVSPHAAISWPMSTGFTAGAHLVLGILPPLNQGALGVYGQTAAVLGYASEKRSFSVGPSFSAYSMWTCSATLCGRAVGVAPGGHALVNVYLYERVGVSVSATFDWIHGRSLVLPGGLATTIIAGPVFRWSTEQT